MILGKIELTGKILRESDFQGRWTKGYKDLGYFVYKLPDANMTTKPYDCIMVDTLGNTFHIELKIIEADSINIDKLRPNQHASLKHISKFNRHAAIVGVWSKKHNDYRIMEYLDFREAATEGGTVKLFDR